MVPFDTVLFDLDGTLCHRTQDTEQLYEAAFDRVGERPFGGPEALWAALEGPPDHDDTVGYFGAGFARVAAQHGRSGVDTLALGRALLSLTDDSAVAALPGVDAALASARGLGSVGVVTNGPESRQQQKLDALGLADAFDTVVYGADLRRSKPHALPFERALDCLGATPEGTVHVGNSLAYDVAGGQNAGLSTVWLRDGDPGAYTPEHVIDAMSELPAILQGER